VDTHSRTEFIEVFMGMTNKVTHRVIPVFLHNVQPTLLIA